MAAARNSPLLAPRWTSGRKLAARRICCFQTGHQPMRSPGDSLLLALQSQSLEHATIFRVELFFHMDFARRHIDEKIIRMRIDVGDVGDAQLPPALNLTLGVGFIFNYDLQEFGFFSPRSRPRWPRSCATHEFDMWMACATCIKSLFRYRRVRRKVNHDAALVACWGSIERETPND